MKISSAKHNKKKRPFIDTGEITITVSQEKNKITGFTVRYRKSAKEFPVIRHDITAAWKKVEQFTKSIK